MKLTLSLLSLLFSAAQLLAEPAIQADFVVAATGSDDNPGTAAKPFATLARARDAVRELIAGGPPKATVTVLVRDGTYVLKDTLVFGPEDSDTPQSRIVYAAYPGEKPDLSGGRAITGWERGEGKRWVADVPAARGGGWRFTQLFVDGKRQTRARLPDTDDWQKWWRVAAGPAHATVFRFPENTLKSWPNTADVEINVIPQYYWQNQVIPLKAVDEKARTATLSVPLSAYAVCAGNPFRAENVPEGVTRPGTWSLDTKTGVVTLWPEDGVDPSRSVVTAPALPLLVHCKGSEDGDRLVHGLTFRGLTFTQAAQVPFPQRDPKDTGTLNTNDCAVLLQGAADCSIESCRFVETGGYGVRLKHAATGNRITENEFIGCGGGGVLLTGYGPGTRDVNRGNVIAGNHIHHCGVFFWHSCAIYGTQSGENIVAFNHIHDMPYGGIFFADCSVDYFKEFRGKQGRGFQFRWDEIGDDPLTPQSVKRFTHSRKNRIVYNTIHQVMQRLHDGGGIHLGVVGGQNVIRGNLIHGSHAARMGVGVYMDGGTNQEVIDGNVVWDCSVPTFDNGEDGPNNNKWGNNVASKEKEEPPEAKILRDTIAAKRKKGLNAPDVAPVRESSPPDLLIGYTEYRTDLPGGRYVNCWTRRAAVVKADGTGRRVLAEELTREKGSWTEFTGWSPDGKTAILTRGWESEENGKWEEEHKTFRFSADGRLYDGYLFDLKSGKATNVTAVERVSSYNVALRFWPGDATKLGFLALVDGVNRPFRMDLDGKNKRDVIKDSPNLVHGMSLSPDGKRGAFEDPAYRLFLADADGSNAKEVKTGQRFHLMPSWSPDGSWVLFVAGEHYDCHPHVIKADGTGLKKLASRNGYSGVIDFLDVYDFHGGSSDLPVWAPDSKSVFYTAKVGKNVELFRVTLDGKSEQLSDGPAGAMYYHPAPSPDGKWLVYGSKRDGVRQLYVMRLSDKKEWRITDLKKGHAAMWASWQPRPAP